MRTFKDLEVWQKICFFCDWDVYHYKVIPKRETYGLVSQLRRASVSLSSNIAEGSKKGKKEFIYFIKIAQGSGAEIETQLIISSNLKYINDEDFKKLLSELEYIMKMLTNLYKAISS
jgi:four helix bundle protein